jgi:hypothetical protein
VITSKIIIEQTGPHNIVVMTVVQNILFFMWGFTGADGGVPLETVPISF